MLPAQNAGFIIKNLAKRFSKLEKENDQDKCPLA